MRAIFTLALGCAAQLGMAAPIAVTVDAGANVHPFDARIFGVAFGDPVRNAQMRYPLVRWGGNSTSRYNWSADFYNTARDYFYENIPNCAAAYCPPGLPQADRFVAAVFAGGAQPLMTVPTIGWVARADSPSQHPYFAGFKVSRYGAQVPLPYSGDAVDPYDTDAGSGDCNPATNASADCVLYDTANGWYHIVNNDPTDTSQAFVPADASAWVAHLQAGFGAAAAGGVRLYALDNEVMLWNSTHRDVHPAPATYAEIWNKTVAFASAIKQQDPQAQVSGPVTWGYCDLFGSAADDCLDGSDRQAHGGMPFVAWYLQQVCSYQQQHGIRLVDYLDLHYYPQDPNGASGTIYSNDNDAATAGRRLRALKELHDPDWTSESWIADLGDAPPWHYAKPGLIPRVRGWIAQYCPGTRLALTEYAWDQDQTSSGAVAQAELFGIFARDGVDIATRWIAPAAGSRVEQAFRLFLDYDGNGARVSGDSVAASSADVDRIGAYAFRGNGRLYVLLTNKDGAAHDVDVHFATPHTTTWQLFGLSAANPVVGALRNGTLSGNALALASLPALSAAMLVLADDDGIFADGFE